MAELLKFTPHTKHIAIKYHHFCSRVQTLFNKSGYIRLKYILTKQQLADILTKPIDDDNFFKLHHMLCGWWYYFSLFSRECENSAHSYSGFKLVDFIFLAHNSTATEDCHSRSVGRSVGQAVGQLVCRSVCCLVGCLVGWNGRSVGWPGWAVGRSVGWPPPPPYFITLLYLTRDIMVVSRW